MTTQHNTGASKDREWKESGQLVNQSGNKGLLDQQRWSIQVWCTRVSFRALLADMTVQG
jgi:hypothetical protein